MQKLVKRTRHLRPEPHEHEEPRGPHEYERSRMADRRESTDRDDVEHKCASRRDVADFCKRSSPDLIVDQMVPTVKSRLPVVEDSTWLSGELRLLTLGVREIEPSK